MHRRSFLNHAAAGAGFLVAPRLWRPSAGWMGASALAPAALPSAGDPALKVLTDAAMDAAKRAGATYADVRLTRTRTLGLGVTNRDVHAPRGSDVIAAGVRVLVDDAWGFLSGPHWTVDDLVQLATAAALQARANRWESARPITLSSTPPVLNGTWATPIIQDPFAVSLDDQLSVLLAAHETIIGKPGFVQASSRIDWSRQEKTFASSEGSYLTQTLYTAFSGAQAAVTANGSGVPTNVTATGLSPMTGGYELLLEAKLEEQFPPLLDQANQKGTVPVDVDIGRYDIVLGAPAMAMLVDQTVGQALQLDRALGFEANAAGTSYLAPPEELLGTMTLAPPFVTVTANRSQPRGAATVKWDDEGVVPEDYTLVKNGVITDYQTTRAQAPWLSQWYAQEHRGIRSHGDAGAPDAFYCTMQQMPNLVLEPAAGNATLLDLVGQVDKGIAILSVFWLFDQQLLNGMAAGAAVEIVKGKLGRPLKNVGLQVRAPDLWKSVATLGGADSSVSVAQQLRKGEPMQQTLHTVTAVPALVKQQNVINFGLRR
jgi:TldD protein